MLQPILSGDPALETVLAGNLAGLPDAHFVWLVDEDDAVAGDVAARLVAAHPGHRIRTLSCPAAPDGVNPKAFKLEIGWRACAQDVLLVLDDDARLPAASLGILAAALEDGALACALPHHAPADGSPSTNGSASAIGLPSALLAAFVDDNAAMTYLAPLRLVGPVSINGMAYAIRRATLERLGGFAPIRHHLADDLGMATMLREANLALVQTAAPVEVRTTLAGWEAYVRQMHRWHLFATLLLSARPARVRLLAIALQAVHPLLLWALVGFAVATPSIGTIATLGLVAALRSAVLRSVREAFRARGPVTPGRLARRRAPAAGASCARDARAHDPLAHPHLPGARARRLRAAVTLLAAPAFGISGERPHADGRTRPPLQVALLTGRSDPRSSALTPVQARFLEALRDPDVAIVPTNFPWPAPEAPASDGADPADGHARAPSVPLLVASVRNAAQYFGSRKRTWAARHRPALESLVGRSDHTILVCGSCGLELLSNLGADPATLARIDVLANRPRGARATALPTRGPRAGPPRPDLAAVDRPGGSPRRRRAHGRLRELRP